MPYGIIEMVQLLVHGAQDLHYAKDIQRLGRYADMHVHVNDACNRLSADHAVILDEHLRYDWRRIINRESADACSILWQSASLVLRAQVRLLDFVPPVRTASWDCRWTATASGSHG